eukprot:6079214-Pyramimonas_sp.AAC.1
MARVIQTQRKYKNYKTQALVSFEAWMKWNGVKWDPAIEMRACNIEAASAAGSRPHYAVFATGPVKEGQVVVDIPKVRCRRVRPVFRRCTRIY